MTLREYIKSIELLTENHQGLLDAPVYYMSDDECNDRHAVEFPPSISKINANGDSVTDGDSPEDLEGATEIVIVN